MVFVIKGRIMECGVFQNRMLRRIFGPKGDELTGNLSQQHLLSMLPLLFVN
jgi:hypothetical protein